MHGPTDTDAANIVSGRHLVVCSKRRVEYEYLIHNNYFERSARDGALLFTTCGDGQIADEWMNIFISLLLLTQRDDAR